MSNTISKDVPEELQYTYKLTDLEINFVSACPQGANPGAKILIKKEKVSMPNNKESQVNVNVDIDALSKSMSENLKKAIADMFAKDKDLSAEAMTEAVVAIVSGDIATMQKTINDDLKKAVDAVQKDIDAKLAEAVKKSTEVAKAAPMEESITVNGTSFKKSELGEHAFAAIKASAAQSEQLRKEVEHERMVTRVEKEFPNVAGKPEDKASLLALIEKADDAVKSTGLAVLKALNEAGKSFKKEDGTVEGNPDAATGSLGTDSDASMRLDKMAQDYANKEGVSVQKAYAIVLNTPEGSKLYEQHRQSK